MSDIRKKVRELEKQQRDEISEVHAKYRELIAALRADCAHEYGKEFMYNGEIPDVNVFNQQFYNQTCQKCGHTKRYLKQPSSGQREG